MKNSYLYWSFNLLVVILLSAHPVFAQQKRTYVNKYRYVPPARKNLNMNYTDEVYSRYTIAVHPFYLFNRGMRIDFETRLRNKDEMLQLSLMGNYYNNSNYSPFVKETDLFDFDIKTKLDSLSRLRGIGLGAGYKCFFYAHSFYFSASTTYNLYSVDYGKEGLQKFTEEGLTYYQGKIIDENQKFHKINSALNIGVQSSLRETFLIDLYVGIGYAYSFYYKHKKPFNDSMTNYGYRGVVVNAGLRIGFSFGKGYSGKK